MFLKQRFISILSGGVSLFFLFVFWITLYELFSSIDPIFGLITLMSGGLICMWKIISDFTSCNRILPSHPDPQLAEIASNVDTFCSKSGLPYLPVFIRQSQEVNIVLYGIGPFLNCLVINQGIFPFLKGGGLRADAILAHEIAHAASWDVLFFTLGFYPLQMTKQTIGILLWIPRLMIGSIAPILKGGLISTFFFGRSCFGFLMIMFFIIIIIGLFLYLGSFVIYGVLFVMLGVLPFCSFLRHREIAADLIAVQWLRKPQPLILALCQTMVSQPIDKQLASLNSGSQNPADPQFLPNLIEVLKTTRLSIPTEFRWKEFFRTHPYIVNRIQKIIASFPQEFV